MNFVLLVLIVLKERVGSPYTDIDGFVQRQKSLNNRLLPQPLPCI